MQRHIAYSSASGKPIAFIDVLTSVFSRKEKRQLGFCCTVLAVENLCVKGILQR
jgi:hypothetical protein